MKKIISTILILVIIASFAPVAASANDTISITIDERPIAFADQGPVISGGRTLVPLRGVFEAVGFEVSWDGAARAATLTRDDYVVVIAIGSREFTTNGNRHQLDVPAQVINGRTMLPIRAVLESVGYDMGWDAAVRTVLITTRHTQIRLHLGVDYVILPVEYTSDVWGGTTRWQFLELQGELNLEDFRPNVEHDMSRLFNSEPGDVLVATFTTGFQFLIIDLGDGKFHERWIYRNLELDPDETIDWDLRQLEEHLAGFKMKRQLTTDNFYWYSTDERSRWLPEMASRLEARLPELLETLGVTLTRRISVFYYSRSDYDIAYSEHHPFELEDMWYSGIAGVRGNNNFSLTRPRGSTTVTDETVILLVHELIHVLQFGYIIDWEAMRELELLERIGWVSEGTAVFFDGGLDRRYIARQVRDGRLLTLDYLEEDFWEKEQSSRSYHWAATIIEFIANRFGMEHVVEMNRRHGDYMGIFGITRSEFERQWHRYLRDDFR